MKYCERPFQHVYIMPNGDVRCCSWTTKVLGNLLKNTLEEIWNSAEAEEIRESVRDGSFRFCRQRSCPRCENHSLVEIDENSEAEKLVPLERPVEFNCAIDYICNHSCPSCRKKVFVPDQEYISHMKQIVEMLKPYLQTAQFLSTDGQGDCFASPYIMEMLETLKPVNPNLKITLETNGVLFDEKHWDRIKHLSPYYIRCVVTANSFQRATYKYLAGNHDDLEKLLRNLHFIKRLREEGAINNFSISMIIQDRNFRELPEFVERCINEFHVDEVRLNPIYKWFQLTEDEYLEKDILNPNHPYYEEYMDVLKDERLKNEKIFWWGGSNIHDQKMMPGTKYRRLYLLASKWLEIRRESPSAYFEYCQKNGYKKILIYGFANLGHQIYEELKDFCPTVVDQNCREWKGMRVIAPENCNWEKYDFIIVTPMNDGEVLAEALKQRTKAHVVTIEDLILKIGKKGI
ncbi:MAG: radical SAM protein [Lachnospiraceae bacterium]|nr:radical SAM protein [Lachnospiraceae bacterium]